MSLEQDIEALRDAVRRQPGCPDKGCSVCRDNRARREASERVIAEAMLVSDARRANAGLADAVRQQSEAIKHAISILNDGFKAPEVMRQLALEALGGAK